MNRKNLKVKMQSSKIQKISRILFFTLFFSGFIFSTVINADTWYVNNEIGVDTTLNDQGKTPEKPFKTIQYGIDEAGNGDTVLVADGIYTGNGNKNLTWDGNVKHITVKSENGPENCIIDCENDGRGFTFYTHQNSTDVISGFTIKNGHTDNGGGIYCFSSSPTITNCTISGNTASHYNGGGIYCQYSSPTIINCTISGNTASSGGGIYCYDYSSPTITNCTISGNSGGGIYCSPYSSPTIINCTISGNAGGDGGGIHCSSTSPTITNCTISGNTANYNGGGIYCFSSSPTITNCIIAGNTASTYGGGINCYYSSPTITNCTISGNTANNYGGGISCDGSSPTITNCILWNNSAGSGNQVYLSGSNSDPAISYCDIQGGESDIGGGGAGSYTGWGLGNINSNPLFVDASSNDYHLGDGSPCIDAGFGDNGETVPTTDKDGKARYDDPGVPNTGGGTPAYVDIGVYERQTPSIIYSISGTISYQGSLSGAIYIGAFDNPEFSGEPIGSTSISSPGAYTISNLPSGTYYVGAFMDLNEDTQVDTGEPQGAYDTNNDGNPNDVTLPPDATGINITLSVKSDINKDGTIDISDVILCLRMAIGLDTPNPTLADMNSDGSVDISDVILVLRKAIGLD